MKKLSILIVDDEVLIRQGLRAILEKEPFVQSLYEAGSPEEFHARLKENDIDLILLDIRLRKASGLELLKSLKKTKQRPKVIAVTGLEGVELIINLLKSGCDGIVYKLDGYKEILRTIEAILEEKHYLPERVKKIIQAELGAQRHYGAGYDDCFAWQNSVLRRAMDSVYGGMPSGSTVRVRLLHPDGTAPPALPGAGN